MANPTPAFMDALYNFCGAINKGFEDHAKGFENLKYGEHGTDAYFKPVTLEVGSKNVRVVQHTGTASVYCFVNIETGDILKAAGYKAPAKGARGNIFKPETYNGYKLGSIGWMYRH